MLNPFPQLFFLSFFAPMLLRLAAALVFFYLAYFHGRNRTAAAREISVLSYETATWMIGLYILIEFFVGAALLLGWGTQWAAIVAIVLILKALVLKSRMPHLVPLARSTYLLLAVICLSLLISGAGIFAHDLPL